MPKLVPTIEAIMACVRLTGKADQYMSSLMQLTVSFGVLICKKVHDWNEAS